ncbi:MAG: peptidylprolyl isomerase [Candidatus Omnitrophota bacterium]|nr:peptidyl-prolyl cis-trans isomerase [Candidatus Omnitrophota bacterium]
MRLRGVVFFVLVLVLFGTNAISVYAEESVADDYVVATLGVEKIYFSEVAKIADGLSQELKNSFANDLQWRYNFIQNYVTLYALAKRAADEKIDKNEEVNFSFENVKRQILSNKLVSDTLSKVNLTQENVERYFESAKVNYQSDEDIRLSYVKLSSKEEADSFMNQLNKGKEFDRLAKKSKVEGNDFISKANPYYKELGNLSFANVLDSFTALGVGGSSNPVEMNSEFYIFHVEEKKPAAKVVLAQVRDRVIQDYTRQVRETVVTNLINETMEQKEVIINTDIITEQFKLSKKEE